MRSTSSGARSARARRALGARVRCARAISDVLRVCSDHDAQLYGDLADAGKRWIAQKSADAGNLPGYSDLVFCPEQGCKFSSAPGAGKLLLALKGLSAAHEHLVNQHVRKDSPHLLKFSCDACDDLRFYSERALSAHQKDDAKKGAKPTLSCSCLAPGPFGNAKQLAAHQTRMGCLQTAPPAAG
jgi:hypothetical protein